MYRCPLAGLILALATLASTALASGTASDARCEKDDKIVSMRQMIEEGRVLDDSTVFERVNNMMNLTELVAMLGPASRDIGSGLHIFIWEARDGSTLRASAGGLCDRLMRFDRTTR